MTPCLIVLFSFRSSSVSGASLLVESLEKTSEMLFLLSTVYYHILKGGGSSVAQIRVWIFAYIMANWSLYFLKQAWMTSTLIRNRMLISVM